MERPILDKISDDILALWDSTMVGRGADADWLAYRTARATIIRKYGYRERAFQRALKAQYEERLAGAWYLEWISTPEPLEGV